MANYIISPEEFRKARFIAGVSDSLTGVDNTGIPVTRVDYEIYYSENYGKYEVIKVTYRGGAIAVRNVTGDSCGCIFEEIAKLVFGGYYEEVIHYREALCDTAKYERIL